MRERERERERMEGKYCTQTRGLISLVVWNAVCNFVQIKLTNIVPKYEGNLMHEIAEFFLDILISTLLTLFLFHH